jgi:murein DD-endopeptidase MepM/ murein hydrolase activator NlpD
MIAPSLPPIALKPPLEAMHVTSPFGVRVSPLTGKSEGHPGVDLRASAGTPVRAAADGVIWRSYLSHPAPPYRSYGECIWIDHRNGWATRYAHLSSRYVEEGQRVLAGDVIGYSGATGDVAHNPDGTPQPHLHWELRFHDVLYDPMQYLEKE